MSLQPHPLKAAVADVARIKNWHPERDRARIVAEINDARYTLWHTESFRRANFHVEGCETVEWFREKCLNCVCPNFPGITLPAGVVDVFGLRWNDLTIEWQMDRLLTNACTYPIRAEKQTRFFERDYAGHRIVFWTDDAKDEGKRIGVHYYDVLGAEHREDLCLSINGVSTPVPVMQFEDVIFPEREGRITVKTEPVTCASTGVIEQRYLGQYHPSITRPEHTHFKIPQLACGLCCGNKVQWKGFQEIQNVRFDTDAVEFRGIDIWRTIFNWKTLLSRDNLKREEEGSLARLTAVINAFNDQRIKAEDSGLANRVIPDGNGLMSTAGYFAEGWEGGYGWT